MHGDSQANAKGSRRRWTGLGQLTLVEHALCPLDPAASLVENLIHAVPTFSWIKIGTCVKHVRESSRHRVCPRRMNSICGAFSLSGPPHRVNTVLPRVLPSHIAR